jgi:hypothetical protein
MVFPRVSDMVDDICNIDFYNLAASDEENSDREQGEG